MPKKTKKDKKEQAETKALWVTTTLFIVFGAIIFGIFNWARTDSQSELAEKIRDLIGIELRGGPTPEPEPEPEPEVFEPEPEVEPEPFVVEEPEPPEPEKIDWKTFRSRTNLWPETLEITVDREVTLTYNGRNYGEITFNSGQTLHIINFSENGYAYGRTGGLEMEVQLSATNFKTWFEREHGDLYDLSYPEKETAKPANDFEQELITKLRRWCLQSYQTPLIEIGEDNLILRWNSRSHGEREMNYSQEALNVARAYLRIQAELGGRDNYASCEIRDAETGALKGSNGIFMPRF